MNNNYLERLFIEELNSEGEEIVIRGSVFLRDQILSKLEPETYELAFKDWKNQRKQQARKVFFMKYKKNQEQISLFLKNIFIKENTKKLHNYYLM
ncbi:hypothetical protein [Haemophilus influenzae]|uniref:hypothetical protein n=1 Tax=Haemophilus influenzae TaxID=727 RepID=UPI000AD82A8D|nr:hypothetical protein [Haemophilus influenzae]